MHIDVTGRGPDLVLIHGWALQGGVFAPLVQRLADQFTLHLVDLPG
ncbi:pimeloyl-[acyl-carrier protein] methyl ester esterase, partial [Raoultella ornithinolytica]